ncbi:MAG: hypothetical protein J3K34DRAFT_526509 [Monoraphidium minutum]|nr:MAG: hypothetical protein J3K34DRAFT_526509 [Monoraphidium minutum]
MRALLFALLWVGALQAMAQDLYVSDVPGAAALLAAEPRHLDLSDDCASEWQQVMCGDIPFSEPGLRADCCASHRPRPLPPGGAAALARASARGAATRSLSPRADVDPSGALWTNPPELRLGTCTPQGVALIPLFTFNAATKATEVTVSQQPAPQPLLPSVIAAVRKAAAGTRGARGAKKALRASLKTLPASAGRFAHPAGHAGGGELALMMAKLSRGDQPQAAAREALLSGSNVAPKFFGTWAFRVDTPADGYGGPMAMAKAEIDYNGVAKNQDDCPANFPEGAPKKNCGHISFVEIDGMMSYKMAVAFYATGQRSYAEHAARILKEWATNNKVFGIPWRNGPLEAAWGCGAMVRAAELLRSSKAFSYSFGQAQANEVMTWVHRQLLNPNVNEVMTWVHRQLLNPNVNEVMTWVHRQLLNPNVNEVMTWVHRQLLNPNVNEVMTWVHRQLLNPNVNEVMTWVHRQLLNPNVNEVMTWVHRQLLNPNVNEVMTWVHRQLLNPNVNEVMTWVHRQLLNPNVNEVMTWVHRQLLNPNVNEVMTWVHRQLLNPNVNEVMTWVHQQLLNPNVNEVMTWVHMQLLNPNVNEVMTWVHRQLLNPNVNEVMTWVHRQLLNPNVNEVMTWVHRQLLNPNVHHYIDTISRLAIERGTKNVYGNWHASAADCMVAAGVLSDNRTLYNKGVGVFRDTVKDYFKWGKGAHAAGRIIGEASETLRDIYHTEFSLGSMIQTAETAWQQNEDLYSVDDYVLAAAMELHACIINAGLDGDEAALPPGFKFFASMPRAPANCTWRWDIQSQLWASYNKVETSKKCSDLEDGVKYALGIVHLPTGWEIGYNHYVGRLGLRLPETARLLGRSWPDTFTFSWGLGTLTHADSAAALWRPGLKRGTLCKRRG